MNNITLVSYEDRLQDSFDIREFLLSLKCDVSLISHGDFLDSTHSHVRSNPVLHIFSQPELAQATVKRQLKQRLLKTETNKNYALLKPGSQGDNQELLNLFSDLFFWPCRQQEIAYRLEQRNCSGEETSSESCAKLMAEFRNFHLIGCTDVFVSALKLIKQVAGFDAPVMLQGETGTGKENAARAIHHLSRRAENGFVPINCATLPDELFESELFGHVKGAFTDAKQTQLGLVEIARGGTLFLDEVDSLSPKAQAALLRFLQTQEYRQLGSRTFCKADVRIIAASNADFDQAIAAQRFRSDLFYRLNVLNISLPPLRERLADIPRIADSLIQKFAREYQRPAKQLNPKAIAWLQAQPWHGNVRELENILLREMLLTESNIIEFQATDDKNQPHTATVGFQRAKQLAVESFEKCYLEALMEKTHGNITEAARICGKERRAIGKMLKKHKIDRRVFEGV